MKTYGSKGIATFRYQRFVKLYGEEHPATRAAYGRLLALQRAVPQQGLISIEAIA